MYVSDFMVCKLYLNIAVFNKDVNNRQDVLRYNSKINRNNKISVMV